MRKAVYISLLVLCVGTGWWLMRTRQFNSRDDSSFPQNSEQASSNQVTGNSPLPRRSNPPKVGVRDLAYLELVRQLMLRENQPIELHARMIDQFGQPVAGVSLKLVLTHVDDKLIKAKFPNMNMGDEIVTETLDLVSDAAGWIRLTGRNGKSLAVQSLTKEGYSWISPPLGSWLYLPGGKHNYGYKGMESAFDRKKGYTFHLWRKGNTETLMPFDYSVGVDPYGTNRYSVNLFRGSVPNNDDADFRFWSGLATNAAGQPFRRFRFEAPNGALLMHSNIYPYAAPSGGYVAAWEWTYEPFGKDYGRNSTDALKQHVYIATRHPKIYASVTWHWNTDLSVRIFGHLNPTGSRNLEPDPAKQITDPGEIRRLDAVTSIAR